ncbi:MAG: hypothetical protein WC851_00255 [Candidatus Shapirobacteria bacterium]|jgi:hypothetical protein
MAEDSTKISATIEIREIEGTTKRVIVCSECREVAAEYGADSRIDEIVLVNTINMHIELRHSSSHQFETYDQARNKMEAGIVLRDRKIH